MRQSVAASPLASSLLIVEKPHMATNLFYLLD
jgi:hypothetical protein